MDGQTLLRKMAQLLTEPSTSSWLDARLSYECLHTAIIATADRINYPTSSETITTVDGTSGYNLSPLFLKLYLLDNQNRHFIKYYDGTSTTFIYPTSYDSIILANSSEETSIPSDFSIVDAADITQLTGTTTSAGTLSNVYTIFGKVLGETTLTDTTADFSDVEIGDTVHNTTDGSSGIVVALSSSTAVICALFDGENNFFASGDAYIINPQQRFKLVIDPPSSTSGHTITVYFVQKPAPVFSYYRRYSFMSGYENAITNYSAWLYKYRDREVDFGDAWFKFWDISTRSAGRIVKANFGREGFKVNLIKRASKSGSYR